MSAMHTSGLLRRSGTHRMRWGACATRTWRWLPVLLLSTLPGVALGAWWNASWNYRVPINVPVNASVNSTIKLDVDFSALGVAGTFDANSPRVVRSDDTLAATQEFTDRIYSGATDAAGNARGEIRFILQDAGPATYYLYFDTIENGAKAANPQTPINGNFERGSTGQEDPIGWTGSKTNTNLDAQVRSSEAVSVTSDGTLVGNGTPIPKTTDGTPRTGDFSYLLGARSNNEASNGISATLSRSLTVPATNAGNLSVNYRIEGWDGSANGGTQWDFLRIRVVGTTTTEIVGPTAGNYATSPFSSNLGLGIAAATSSGYGQYNGWDTDTNGTHRSGMTPARGTQPWWNRTFSLAGFAGQTVMLQFVTSHQTQYRSWFHIDDVEWSVVSVTLGALETQVAAPGGFNAFETATAAGSVTGVIKTKIAASAFNLDIIAIKTSGTAIETAFAGGVKIELVDASSGASCGAYALIRNLGTLTFVAADLGRKTLAGINESNAWPNARIRMSYPETGAPTIVACSTDNFAIRPASFGGVTVSDADSVTAGTARTLSNTAVTGGNVHKAGRPFRIAATALNAVAAATSNYAGNPASSLTGCVLPGSGCTLGTLATGTWSSATGALTTTTATYSEVGAFAMKLVDASFAAVDAADGSTLAERNIESAAFNVGRFVPDHFVLTTASTPQFKTFNDTACPTRSFTYIGQPFGYLTLPQATITAKNAAGGTTTNYAGALWKLAAAGATQAYTAVTGTLDTGLVGTPTVTASGGGVGTLAANAADVVAFTRTAPVAPFMASISLSMSIVDSSENAITGNGLINTAAPALFSSMAFDSGNGIRFGQLVLTNAHGSELLDLPVPIETRFWTGSGFSRNTADACTQLAATNVALSNWRRDLNACETSVTLSGRFNAGRGNLKLSKPGTGNTGSVDLTLLLGATGAGSTCVGVPGAVSAAGAASQSWLQGRWSGAAYDQNPAARGSFGLHRGSKPLIYFREMY